MIHFFATNMKPGVRTALHDELDRIGAPYAVISDAIDKSYNRRWQLFLRVLPAIALFALRASWKSLTERDRPDAVVLWSDPEVLIYALLKVLLRKSDVKIILAGFIYTSRRSSTLSKLRRRYFRFVLGRADCIVCHSRWETVRYGEIFPDLKERFVFAFWGANLVHRERHLKEGQMLSERDRPYVLAAGRSGRDYASLFMAWRNVDLPLHVVCNQIDVIPRQHLSDRIRVLSTCSGEDYFREITHSKFVVVPLQPSDISAGQMVLVQAMALGRACIITETPTTIEYVDHLRNGILVKPNDPAGLAAAVRQLAADPDLRERLESAALQTFQTRHAFAIHIADLVRIIQDAASAGRSSVRQPLSA